MSDLRGNILEISGGDLSDWVYGTDLYTAPDGYVIVSAQPGSSGCTLNTGTLWQKDKNTAAEAVTNAVGSKWFGQSVTGGVIVPKYPLTKVKLSAGDCMVYLRKSDWR